MTRRLVATIVAISLGSWALAAAERVTFVLVNGERISGTVAFHTSTRENLIDGDLNIGLADGKEQQIHVNQVVVIEFLAGTPQNNELSALPEGSGQMLVMRNGDIRHGQFVNLIGGDTVRWKNESNQTDEMPIRDVTRIYLNADNARRLYNFTGPRGRRGNNAGRGSNITTAPGEIEVQANMPWNDTGLDVRRGEQIAFSVRGEIAFGQGPTQRSSADGDASTRTQAAPVQNMGVGGLIARVGNSAPFPVGNNRNAITMPATGRLMLAVNDDNYNDNSGAYRVTIARR
jgi:hypothetical protein